MTLGAYVCRIATFLLCITTVRPTSLHIPSVSCSTTKGTILIEIYEDWAPVGAQHFLTLVKDGFFSDIALYRSVPGFLVQFGISDNPSLKHWHHEAVKDDPNLHKGIHKHYLSYAGAGPNTRSTQLFIAYEDLPFLGKEPWEVPFGRVIDDNHVLDSIFKDYGDIPPFGNGPDQIKLHQYGNDYIRKNFPLTDFIISCEVIEEEQQPRDVEPVEVPIAALASSNLRNQTRLDRTMLISQKVVEERKTFPAFVALLLLLVAVFLLWCLYQYNASPEGAKSN